MARKRDNETRELLIHEGGQLGLVDKSVEQEILEDDGAVECLGMRFESDEARRMYFTKRLRQTVADAEFRKMPGFPRATDDDILRLSEPPYYTACPNPFLEDFIRSYGRPYDAAERYDREPLAIDVSEGKTDPLYKAHGYHTKVPHLAIVPSILHYTRPGDIVLDAFAGSGMTGVAAQWCGSAPADYRAAIEARWKSEGRGRPEWGARRTILGDLSPAATFIAANYNLPFDVVAFERTAKRILREISEEIGWMYETLHTDGRTKGRLDYMVWSEVFICPQCGGDVVFVHEALDAATKRVRDEFPCPSCGATVRKDTLERSFETRVDPITGKPWRRIRLRPVLKSYTADGDRYESSVDAADLALLDRIERLPFPPDVPGTPFPIDQMYHGSRLEPKGFTHIHHLYLPRQAHVLAALWRKAINLSDERLRATLLFTVEQLVRNMSLLNAYEPLAFSQNARGQKGVYYVPSQMSEVSPWYFLDGKIARVAKAFRSTQFGNGASIVTTGDCAALPMSASSVDYIFTDPPFGANIPYSDLNFLVEAWHRIYTETAVEAIVDQPKKKGLHEYQDLMRRCFTEYRRVLKPGRWMTVVFSNSSNAVWRAIQEAIGTAGFVVADVRTLDKQQGSYRQVTSSAVKQDLVISAYKPSAHLEKQFALDAGAEDGVWDFVREHLARAAPFVEDADGNAEVVAERTRFGLFDRMIAFHVQRGVAVPMSNAEFYAGLSGRFPERDGMFFLPEQAAEYDRRRLTVRGVAQLELFVTDERSAIEWLRQELGANRQTYSDIMPKFVRELRQAKHEQLPELRDLLRQTFLEDHEGRWYVPDPNKQADLERVREAALLREFEAYRSAKRLKTLRTEAVRIGFKDAWAKRDYRTIIEIGDRLPQNVLQEDETLLVYYDNASLRLDA